MNSLALTSSDREAISQLRALLKTEHRLNPAEEERLIASFLEQRERQDGQMSIQHWRRPSLAAIAQQPSVVLAGVVGLNVATVVALWRAVNANCLTCGDRYGGGFQVGAFATSPQGALLAASIAFALLPLVVLGAALLWRPLQISGRMRAAMATFIAGSLVVGAIEAIAVGWGTYYQDGSTDHFIAANIVALLIALVIAAYGAITSRVPPPTLIQIVYQGRPSMATKRLPGADE